MYRNFLEAKRYFAHWRLRDLFDAINNMTISSYAPPYQWGTWGEGGFFGKPYSEMATIPMIKEALATAHAGSSVFDIEYLSRSADKYISMHLAHRIAKEFGRSYEVTDFDPSKPLEGATGEEAYDLIKMLLLDLEQRFGANLLAIAKAYFTSEYNPIENYSMTQTETPNITETLHTETNTNLTTDGEAHGDVYGFNSATASHLNAGDNTQTTSGDKDDNFSDSSRSETGTRTLTRAGNIGVTTSQQMLTSEIELRRFDFLNELYKCMDKILVASVY